MPYLLDADWFIQALDNREPATSMLDRLTSAGVAVSWVTACEVFEGAYKSSNPEARLVAVRQFMSGYRLLNLNDGIATRFAEARAFLRRRGEMIADLDLLIAATALTYNLTLLTFNRRHFDRVPGLRLYPSV